MGGRGPKSVYSWMDGGTVLRMMLEIYNDCLFFLNMFYKI